MSQAQTNPDDQPVTEKHEKDVVITAYANGDYEDRREFIDAVFGEQTDVDIFETYEQETHNVELEVTVTGDSKFGEKEVTRSVSPFTSSDKEAFVNGLEGEELPDFMSLTNTVTTSEEFENTPRVPINTFIKNNVTSDALDDLGFEGGSFSYPRAWTKEVEDTSVDSDSDDMIAHDARLNARSSGIKQRQVLVHQSERSKDNQYEGEEEHWSFEVKAHLESGSADELDEVSERIVPEVYELLFNLEEISCVRLTSCEQNVSKIGQCYNF